MNRRRVAGTTAVLAALIAPAAVYGAFPGSNGRIFFDTGGPGRDIVSVDPQGGDRTKVTQGQEPAVSPNGRVIAFVRRGDIYLSNKLGGDERQLTDTPIVERTPSWSPQRQPTRLRNRSPQRRRRRHRVDPRRRQRSRAPDRERAGGLQSLLLAERQQDRLRPCFQPPGRSTDPQDRFRRFQSSPAHVIELRLVRPSDLVAGRQPDRVRALRQGLAVAVFDRARRFERVAADLPERSNIDREPAYSPSGNKIVYGGPSGRRRRLWPVRDPALGGQREKLTEARPVGRRRQPVLGLDAVATGSAAATARGSGASGTGR